MRFRSLLQFINILNVIWLSGFLQNTESIPASSSKFFIPDVANSSPTTEYSKSDNDEGKVITEIISSSELSNEFEEVTTDDSTEYSNINSRKKSLRENLLATIVVPYLCDVERGKCWLNENQKNLVTFFIPIKLLPNKQPPTEIEMKEFYSLVNKKKKPQMDNFDSNKLHQIVQDHYASSDAHRRRKRDTQYAEGNDGSQQYWGNQGENENEQLFRAQRDVPSTSTEPETTSTEGRTQRNAELQSSKQSKRSAETREDEADDTELGSPSPDEDYQDDEESDYQPEKRFAGPDMTGTTQNYDDSSTKNPSQTLYRREAAMNPSYNYPYFTNPGLYYPQQRLVSPYDGMSYRSVDAFPMLYMDSNPAFWQSKVARSPRRFYSQRQAGGYGGGWPPMPSYYQPYGNRYQPSYLSQVQQPRGHYRHQYPQKSSYGGYRPFSYNYAQGKKAPARKPIETDAHMYYGK